MTINKSYIFLLTLLILLTFPLFSETTSSTEDVSDNLAVSLAFIGPADALYSWWGHVAVIVENTATGAARYYDYGNFSFDQDSFVRNFVMGRLYFLKMASDPKRQLRYSAFMNRDVTIYSLNIPHDKEIELYKFLENDILPENRIYLYDHFYDNCSTRIRDMIDIITDDEFSKTYSSLSDKTLRMQLRRSTFNRPFMDWLLNFAMNGSVDRPATELDGMFLPHELERGIKSMMVHDENGELQPFVKDINVYNKAEGRDEIRDYPPPRWPMGLAVGLILAAAAWFLFRNSQTRRIKRNSTAIYSAILALILTIPGTLLFFLACFTDHSFAYWNMNLLFINPFLLATLVFSIRLLTKKKAGLRSINICWSITAFGALLSVLLKIIPFFRQDNWDSLFIVLPSALLLGILPLYKDIMTKRENRSTADSL